MHTYMCKGFDSSMRAGKGMCVHWQSSLFKGQFRLFDLIFLRKKKILFHNSAKKKEHANYGQSAVG
jgi:hypothetical protein